jgi:hypothetical protein
MAKFMVIVGGADLDKRSGNREFLPVMFEGPFIESKDAVGGIFIIEATSLDDATEVARSCPALTLQNGYVEVRLVEEKRSANP